jgi:hypothetical protein
MHIMNVNINQSLLNIVIAFSAFVGGAVALALLYAAFLLIFAGDDAAQELKAKKAIGTAIFGAVIGLAAITIANLVIKNIK